jgi:membrane protein implicated in regulation of membrane protease activity
MRRTVYHWFKLFLLLSDGFIIAFVVLLVLWKLGIELSPGVIAAIAVILLVISFISYKVLRPVIGDKTSLSNSMIGLEGEVVRPLDPDGVVRVRGELWKATTADKYAETGARVEVVGMDRLRLLVEMKHSAD